MIKNTTIFLFIFLIVRNGILYPQDISTLNLDYNKPKEFEIADIKIKGIKYLDVNAIIMISGLNIGDKILIPSDQISNAIRKLWNQGLTENVKIEIEKIEGNKIFLIIEMVERPRIKQIKYSGIRKSTINTLNDELKIRSGEVANNYLINSIKRKVTKYYVEKGFLNCEVNIRQIRDASQDNSVILNIDINKNDKIKIYKINIFGNDEVSDQKVKTFMKETKEKSNLKFLKELDNLVLDVISTSLRLNFSDLIDSTSKFLQDNLKLRIFKSSKLIQDKYADDKAVIIEKYNSLGYRDAKIVKDSVYSLGDGLINIDLYVDEGSKYYFRNITWVGNTKYNATTLSDYLKIKKGDVYNKERLEKSLNYDPNDIDVSSLYMDDGYLFFNAAPVEVMVENDSIDIEIRINEGKQAHINRVTLVGNTRTNDHVVMREIRTRPGQLFNRELIIRTTRELAQLRYFNPETIKPDVRPDPLGNTADIEYSVEETSSDQVEFSGGYGYGRIMGSLGLTFNNFSLRGIFKKGTWKPIPTGDGQRLSLKFQTYGKGYFNYNVSFTEPWFGGKKPNSFAVSFYHSSFSNSNYYEEDDEQYMSFVTDGFVLGLGKRLTWPDDFFTLSQSVKFLLYNLKNYSVFTFGTGTGNFNNFSYTIALGRNSISAPIYPRYGSDMEFSLELTFPYSAFSDKNYRELDEDEKFKWVEFYKINFNSAWYFELLDKLVLSTRLKFGYIGTYNNDIGVTPFGRFYVGGDGLSNSYNMDGREIIAMRGYENEVLPSKVTNESDYNLGGTIYTKYTIELRYPLSLNPSSTVYALAFMEAGNAWRSIDDYDPFNVYRSAGIGVRIFMPMFGVLGLDWAYGFDPIPGLPDAHGQHFHFSLNQSIN